MGKAAADGHVDVGQHGQSAQGDGREGDSPEEFIAQLERALDPEEIPGGGCSQWRDLRVGVIFQRGMIEPDAQDGNNEGGYAQPHQFVGQHVGDEIDAFVERNALGGVFSDVLFLRRQTVAVNDDFVIMDAGKDKQQGRQGQNMQEIETEQAVGA